MSTRSPKQKAISLLSPLLCLFASQQSSKTRSATSPLRECKTSLGSISDQDPHNLLDFASPQAASPTEIEDVTSPASGKSHMATNSGNSLFFSPEGDSEARRENIDGLPQQLRVDSEHTDNANSESEGQTRSEAEAGIFGLADTVPMFLKVLEVVATIHPAVKVVVVAFSGAYKLQCARTENDERIKKLDTRMKEMLETFSLLKDVRDPSDLRRISSRIEKIAHRTAKDIKQYSACTDAYMNKPLLLKVLMSPMWEQRLLQFATDFAERRTEIRDALSLCSARGISKLQQDMQEMEKRTEALVEFFELNVPPKETKVRNELAKLKNGDIQKLIKWTPIDKDTSREMKSIIDLANNLERNGVGRKDKAPKYTMENLLTELRVGVDETIRQHMEILESKIALQDPTSNRSSRRENEKKQFMHERIVDPELSIIWKEMNWSRNVKASRFVSTLRDHFQETLQNKKVSEDSIKGPPGVADEWALPYIDVKWLQPIVESFDEDGSGYVTISEINHFTQSKPSELDWSLRQWIAYWAIGWRINMTRYRELAQLYLRDIYTTLPKLLPVNRKLGETYFSDFWDQLSGLVVSLPLWDIPDGLVDRFDDYVSLEEKRIAKNLERLGYNIDAPNTVNMIVGTGVRIEKNVFPLIYLMLKQHSTLIQRGTVEVISRDEVLNASNSLTYIRKAVDARISQLTENWDQQRLDSKARLETFAWGIFRSLDAESLTIQDVKELRNLTDPPLRREFYRTQSTWKKTEDLWTKYEESASELPPCRLRSSFRPLLSVETYTAPDTRIPENSRVPKGLSSLLGRWNGLLSVDTSEGSDQKLRLTFLFREPVEPEKPSSSVLTFGDSSTTQYGEAYTLSGVATVEEDKSITFNFFIKYIGSRDEFKGIKADGSGAIVGSWKTYHDDPALESVTGSFVLLQVSEDVIDLLKSPRVLVWNRARVLWKLAIDFVTHLIKQKTWKALRERRERRKQFIELHAKAKSSSLSDGEYDILIGFYDSLSLADIQYYRSLGDNLYNTMPEHFNVCDVCDRTIHGARVLCMDCNIPSSSALDTLDLCDSPECAATTYPRRDPPALHKPTHDIIKFRSVVQTIDLPRYLDEGQRVLETSRRTWKSYGRSHESEGDVKDPSCSVCKCPLARPCWCCMSCKDHYLCDECERKNLLSCVQCSQAFPQPSWYYGESFEDDFRCNMCQLKAQPTNSEISMETLHRYTHPLVRCKDPAEDPKPLDPLSEIRQGMVNLKENFDGRLGGVEDRLMRLEEKLNRLTERLEKAVVAQTPIAVAPGENSRETD